MIREHTGSGFFLHVPVNSSVINSLISHVNIEGKGCITVKVFDDNNQTHVVYCFKTDRKGERKVAARFGKSWLIVAS
jgi:hypothetical protein